ncbi:hypothetical protein [Alkaliphilus hydrothermalis]|uniref:Uncharacterized protein n=1 Tax=Alkaliphilus hydrothermalis TaxID=1482730 RepID=A0ABS2NKU6_9FIRM|nr:hypothetical protein [Alkaliphilus hydrothermalis]MBM7613558.1 hypothetical protein [Alkaliphilus hydrothermalis]
MKIKDVAEISELNNEDGLMDIILSVDLDEEVASRWEVTDPKVWAVYQKHGDLKLDHIELVDQGMNVHGFEFTDEDRQEILRFIEGKIINQD